MSDIPKYDGTVHPEAWIKDVQAKCLISNLRQERDILKMCKLNIALSINFPNDINNLNELIKALKEHPTFEIYKNGCKERLDHMTFEGGEGGDTTQFLADFRSLIDNAEITNPQEIKNRLLRTYSTNEFFKNEFSKRSTGITNIDEIYRLYSDVVSDSSKVIKYGPEWLIAIKHRETGRYLSSRETNYETGSKRQIVYAGEKILNENIWWYATCETPVPQKKTFQENKVLYDDVVYLTHSKTKATLSLSDFYRSPKTSYAEVHGFPYSYSNLRFVKTNETNEQNNSPYLKVRDRVNIKTDTDYTLRSQEVSFGLEDKLYQEVVGHKEKVGRDDEWLLEKK